MDSDLYEAILERDRNAVRANQLAAEKARLRDKLSSCQESLLYCHEKANKERQRFDIENARLRERLAAAEKLCQRSLAIITVAIMHGMPITEEVAAVRNAVVRLDAATAEEGAQ